MKKTPYKALSSGTLIGLNRDYTIQNLLAIGGMGAVYKGIKKGSPGFVLPVAIKELLPHLSEQRALIELFYSEAKIHARMNHANIVQVVDLFKCKDRYYIVFEWVDGMDMRVLIKTMKSLGLILPVEAGLFVLHEMLSALHYAHNLYLPDKGINGIIHRDISPSNILLSYVGEVKLTDFGISQAGERLTKFKKVLGKKGYMPPEQREGSIGEEKSDIYSLAVSFIEAMSLKNPLLSAEFVIKLRDYRDDIPPELDDLLNTAMADDVSVRPTAAEMLETLSQIQYSRSLRLSGTILSDFLRDIKRLKAN